HRLQADSGIFVVQVEPGSPAERAAVVSGDVLIGFDGQPTAGIDDLLRLLTAERVVVAATVDLLRGTERISRSIVPPEPPPGGQPGWARWGRSGLRRTGCQCRAARRRSSSWAVSASSSPT